MRRFATIMTIEAGEDLKPARKEVIAIASREEGWGPPPLAAMEKDRAARYSVVEVPAGVQVGMVRGGPIDAAGGFGWPAVSDRIVHQIDDKRRGGGVPRSDAFGGRQRR